MRHALCDGCGLGVCAGDIGAPGLGSPQESAQSCHDSSGVLWHSAFHDAPVFPGQLILDRAHQAASLLVLTATPIVLHYFGHGSGFGATHSGFAPELAGVWRLHRAVHPGRSWQGHGGGHAALRNLAVSGPLGARNIRLPAPAHGRNHLLSPGMCCGSHPSHRAAAHPAGSGKS